MLQLSSIIKHPTFEETKRLEMAVRLQVSRTPYTGTASGKPAQNRTNVVGAGFMEAMVMVTNDFNDVRFPDKTA
jgi:hypothetical protein